MSPAESSPPVLEEGSLLLQLLSEVESCCADEDQRTSETGARVIALARQAGQLEIEVRARLAVAWMELETQPAVAREHTLVALEQAERLENPVLLAGAHCVTARMAVSQGDANLVEVHAHHALSAAEQADHAEYRAHAHSLLGIALSLHGKYDQAVEHFDAALRGIRSEWPATIQATLLNDASVTLTDIGRYEDARRHLEESLRIATTHRLHLSRVIAQLNLGIVLLELGDRDASERVLREGLTAVRAQGQLQRWEAYLLSTLGQHAIRHGQLREGHVDLARALEIALSGEDASLMASSHLQFAENLARLNRPELVRVHLESALRVANAARLGSLASTAHLRLSELHEAQQDLDAALRHFRQYHELTMDIQREGAQRRAQLMVLQRELDLSRQVAQTQRQLNAELAETNARLLQAHERVRLQSEKLARMAREDALTGIANRRHFIEVLNHRFAVARRAQTPLSVVILDADHFKRVNDRHGHPTGDAVLRVLAQLLDEQTRNDDLVARLGGEEFAMLFVGLDRAGARDIAERTRTRVKTHDWLAIASPLAMTLSMGVADSTEVDSVERLLALADHRLYVAKESGRDRVV